ncbi:hypothetical protein JCM15519_15060 [Fundidesulfovibrio butyratiphilus]
MNELLDWQRRLRPLLSLPAGLYALGRRASAWLYRKRLLPSWNPKAPCVGVGTLAVGAWGETLVSAWMLGWARARGLRAAALVHPGWGGPSDPPMRVDAGTDPFHCGAQAALLARYRPEALVYCDRRPARAGRAAKKAANPDFYLLCGHFSDLSARRGADVVVLTPQDLDKGWNRPLPAGWWRESAQALNRAAAFVVCISPEDLTLRRNLVERRLAKFGKPVFPLHPRLWRLRRPTTGETTETLDGEPYMLVAGDSHHDMAAKAARAFLGQGPRFQIIVDDAHHFTPQDRAQIAQEATRMKTPHVLATPEAALGLDRVPGRVLWTYDPDVVIGPCLLGGQAFTPWWETIFADLG